MPCCSCTTIVAGLEFQRVDGVAAPARHLAHVLGGRAAAAGDVGAGQDRQPRGRVDEPVAEGAAGDHWRGPGRIGEAVGQGHADAGVTQHLGGALGRTVALEDQRDPPAVGGPLPDVVDDPGGFAVIEARRRGRERQLAALVRSHVRDAGQLTFEPRCIGVVRLGRILDRHTERRHRPPRQIQVGRDRPHLGEGAERDSRDVDRGLATDRGRSPAGLQELFAGTHQVVRSGADPLRVAEQHVGAAPACSRAATRGCRCRPAAPEPATPCPRPGCPRRACPGSRRSPGAPATSCAALRRTGSVSSSSRQAGAHSRSTFSMVRWSATAKVRMSSTSSPQNSIRTGCSSVGAKTSSRPPRTANSPRLVTRSTRAYARSDSRRPIASRSASVPARSSTGSRSPRPLSCGCSTDADRRDDDLDRAPGRDRSRPGAPAGAARRAGGRRCPIAVTAARAAASPRPGRPRSARPG